MNTPTMRIPLSGMVAGGYQQPAGTGLAAESAALAEQAKLWLFHAVHGCLRSRQVVPFPEPLAEQPVVTICVTALCERSFSFHASVLGR